jgi:hypothetical protein
MPPPALPVFTDWQVHSSLESILSACKSLLEDMTFLTVRAWRAQGGRVLGHFQVYFPEQLAFAAWMLSFRVRGGPLEARHSDSHFGSYLCSILKTSLELAPSQRVPLDLFVSHPICDAARNLAAIWGRNRDYGCQVLYMPQNATSAHLPHSSAVVPRLLAVGWQPRFATDSERVEGAVEIYRQLVSRFAGNVFPPRPLRMCAGLARWRPRVLTS